MKAIVFKVTESSTFYELFERLWLSVDMILKFAQKRPILWVIKYIAGKPALVPKRD
jgi:hypothetical protein